MWNAPRTARSPAAKSANAKRCGWPSCWRCISFALILPLNPLTWLLSFPAAFLAASYPFTKRFFAIPQAYLGIAFGFGIPMAFAAQLGHVPPVAWVLLLANVFWAIAYDTEYAMVDRDDDIHLGIHSSALFFGKYDVAAVMACYAITLVLLAVAGLMAGLGMAYFVGLDRRGRHRAASLQAHQGPKPRKMLRGFSAQQLVRGGGVCGVGGGLLGAVKCRMGWAQR